MSTPKSDITTNRAWEAKQQNRLLGFEILRKALGVNQGELTEDDLKDRTGIEKRVPGELYHRKFLPRFLKRIGAESVDDALRTVRQMRGKMR